MKKTLLVTYLPSGPKSNSRRLSEHFESFASRAKNHRLEKLDLLQEQPRFFDVTSMQAYYARNYAGKPITPEQTEAIRPLDRMCDRFAEADVVAMAFPMHNFGMPGAVKTYFDAVMQKGRTFDYAAGEPVGLMKGKKALVMFTSGGEYDGTGADWDTLTRLARIEFEFMGFDEIEVVHSYGMSVPDNKEKSLSAARDRIGAVADKWLG